MSEKHPEDVPCPDCGKPAALGHYRGCPRFGKNAPTTILERITGRKSEDEPIYGPSNTGG